MKNKFFVLGMALVLGFVFIGCPGTSGTGETTVPITTVDPPVEIRTLAQLTAIGANAASLSKNYKLTADITGPVTSPIGAVSGNMPIPFTGDFDGNGHTIAVNITQGLSVPTGSAAGTFAGLFAIVGNQTGNPGTSGTIHDLTVTGTIAITAAPNSVYAGGVAGMLLPTGSVSKVSSSVTVSAEGGGSANAGGVVGHSQAGTVSNVYATGDISATTNGDSMGAGGIVGASSGGTVKYAYATGSISAAATGTGLSETWQPDGVTVCASGIVGGSNPDPQISYTVALNSAVSASGTNYFKNPCRILSTPNGTVTPGPNYGKADLTPIAGSSPASMDKGVNGEDGVDVTVTGGSPYTAPDQAWWTNTGFSGADWTNVWQWDSAKGLPVLR